MLEDDVSGQATRITRAVLAITSAIRSVDAEICH
jgi:hypothetical protein